MRRYLSDRVPVAAVRAQLDDDGTGGRDAWEGLAALGVAGLLVPEANGGAGAGMVDAGIVLEELGRALYPGPYMSSAVGAAGLVALAGDAADRDALLPDLAAGARIGAVALDPGMLAEVGAGGWALTGELQHVPDVLAADVLVVRALTPDSDAVFVVELSADGVARTSTPTVDGTRKQGSVTLAATPARRLAGDDPAAALAATADRLVTAAAVEGVGTASLALEMAVGYARERRQFDRPIGSFQAVQHLCADMLQTVELARAGAYYACWAADAADATERHRAATMALAYAADGLHTVGTSLIQVHGGIGFTWEHDAHLLYKRLLSLRQFRGGTLAQLEELASLILD